jgi:hypothetical protein
MRHQTIVWPRDFAKSVGIAGTKSRNIGESGSPYLTHLEVRKKEPCSPCILISKCSWITVCITLAIHSNSKAFLIITSKNCKIHPVMCHLIQVWEGYSAINFSAFYSLITKSDWTSIETVLAPKLSIVHLMSRCTTTSPQESYATGSRAWSKKATRASQVATLHVRHDSVALYQIQLHC